MQEPSDKTLHLAEILYETGELHYRYARVMSPDGTKWIRAGLFVAYHQNGQVQSEGHYEEGLEHGVWKDFFPNGKVAAEGQYNLGKESGKWRFYKEDGSLAEETTYP